MLTSRRFASFWTATGFIFVLAHAVAGQSVLIGPSVMTPPAPSQPAPPNVADKRAENAEQLRVAMRKLEATGAGDNVAAQDVAFYQTREAVLAQQEAVEQRIKDLEARKTELDAQLKSPPVDEKACTFAELDQLKDDLATNEARDALVADKLASAQASVGAAQSALAESQVKLGKAQDALESGKGTADAAKLAAEVKRAQQAVELATETLALRKREVVREQRSQEVLRLSAQVQKGTIARMSSLVVFSEKDYQEQIDDIKKNEDAAASSLSAAEEALRHIEPKWREAKIQLDAATEADRPLLTEKYQAMRRTRLKLSDEVNSQIQQLQRLAQLRTAWQRRYQIAADQRDSTDSQAFAELKAQQKETKAVLSELASGTRTQIAEIGDVRDTLTGVTKRAEAAAKGPANILSWIQQQQRQLEGMQQIYERNLMTIESSRRVHEKLLDEINVRVKAITPTTLALDAWYQVGLVWNHQMLQINDKWITVGMAIEGLATLVIGWVLSRFVSALVAYRVLKRFRLSKDATSAIRALVFYSMLVAVGLQALHVVNVDLTAFTILGGALAIGVGFGSQALVNNFIGGLIMLAERPVRLGERITFGGMDGIVEDVGFRCTKLRTNADHLLTIPNSTLVNEKIENIDRRRTIRRKINIAVSYNVTRELLALGVQAIRDILEQKEIRERIHPIVGFEECSPRVFFSEFAAESLTIQVVYWFAPVDWWAFMEHSERVNYRIMEEFDRLGIEFAFPSKTSFVKNQKKAATRAPDSYAA
jgi:potassium-dependent mechanosensitive channel